MDRVGHVYYWSLPDDLWLVIDKTPALLESGGTMWQCFSLETGQLRWFSDYDADHMFVRYA